MGYRSSVAMMITGDEAIIASIVAKMKLTMPEIFATDYWAEAFTFGDDYIKFAVHDVKWYDGYEDVDKLDKWYKEIEEMYNEASSTDDPMSNLCGKFVRIGEDVGDIEEEYFGNDYIDSPYVSRTIEWYN
jgi:hypothetical protein|tara:strand:+ start:4657 stop:5046 length:390 start_codon:yes stop_codon:yes gene_type:complete